MYTSILMGTFGEMLGQLWMGLHRRDFAPSFALGRPVAGLGGLVWRARGVVLAVTVDDMWHVLRRLN
jgi:hypothetical protein